MTTVPIAGIVQGDEEVEAVNRVLASSWHGSGIECASLQEELAEYFQVKRAVVVNSGSMANLIALSVLGLEPGSKVLTSGGGFPATLNPILHLGLVPVLVDYQLPAHNVDEKLIEEAIRSDPAIKAVIVAHTVGNPLDVASMSHLCQERGVALIEDCCEAIGSRLHGKPLGGFGTTGTLSFYPSHQINGFGGGGALLTDDIQLAERATSLRDWGKVPVREGDNLTRLNEIVDGIPYDQQYTYLNVGYNTRFPDGNCAYTREQLRKLDSFNAIRRRNYHHLQSMLIDLPLISMSIIEGADPAFFAYPVTLAMEARQSRDDLVRFLEGRGVRTRLFFAGNITRHRPYRHLKCSLPVADHLMARSLLCGCWHGLDETQIQHVGASIRAFFN